MAKGIAKGKAEGIVEGLMEGKLESMRTLIVKLVKNRFPKLSSVVEQHVQGIEQLDTLDTLIDQLMQVTSEHEARTILHLPPGS